MRNLPKVLLACVLLSVLTSFLSVAQNFPFSGTVKNSVSGAPLEGVNVYVTNLSTGVVTESSGYFIMFLPQGVHAVEFSSVGFESKRRNVPVYRAMTINIDLDESSQLLQEVSVSGQAEDHNISSVALGVSKMSMKTIEKMPTFMGEVDVMKSLLMFPGVTTVGEGTTGINVRGGNIDQNLILLDDAPVFNSSHLMGLFSVFNPDVVRDISFYRGAIPAQYGGRASSVLDIKIRTPETEQMKVQGGIGLIANRLLLEGPLNRKISFLVGGRASFPDYLLKLAPNKSIQDTRANFYDITAKVLYQINDDNKLQLSLYRSADKFKLASDSLSALEVNATSSQYDWETTNATIRWDYAFSPDFIANIVGVYSDYNASISSLVPAVGFKLPSAIKYRKAKADFSWLKGSHTIMFGGAGTQYILEPGHLQPTSRESNINAQLLQNEYGLELAGFASDELIVNTKLTVMAGFRYSYFQNMGDRDVYSYQQGVPLTHESMVDTTHYSKGERINSYGGAEPRLSLKYSLNPTASIKVGYNKMRQYLQIISNTTASMPIDRWQLSNTYSKPIIADQVSVGYFKNLRENMYELSAEVFYKTTQNLSDYKDGADLLLNPALETAILHGNGFAYGVELQAKKNMGRLTGWLSYTFSQARIRTKTEFVEEQISNGNYYPTNFNKPHILNLSAIFKQSARVSFSANFTYSSGRPTTYPLDKYYYHGAYVPYYENRNQFRIPDYHRLDLAMTIDDKPSRQARWKGSWVFSIYNVYARKNAYSVFFKPNNQLYYAHADVYKLSIFGAIFPSITYNFTF
jgi:ferric enterobactin receptor